MDNYLRVGVIASTHGIRGEVKVYPTTEDASRFKTLKEVVLDTGKEYLNLEVSGVKFFKNMVILKFKGIDNINDIEKYKGKDLLVTRENAIPLEEGEYYIFDVLGSKVVTEDGMEVGELKEILQTGANDVYVVKTANGKEVLIPSIPQCILDINVDEKIVKVHLLDGMME